MVGDQASRPRWSCCVTRPGSYYSVTYYKPKDSPGLLAKRIANTDDLRIPMTAAEFLAQAWEARKRQGDRTRLDCVISLRAPRHSCDRFRGDENAAVIIKGSLSVEGLTRQVFN